MRVFSCIIDGVNSVLLFCSKSTLNVTIYFDTSVGVCVVKRNPKKNFLLY
jgi:hypothetical protein